MAVVRDPQFLVEAMKSEIEVTDPVGSDRMTAVLEKAYATPLSIVTRARRLYATGP